MEKNIRQEGREWQVCQHFAQTQQVSTTSLTKTAGLFGSDSHRYFYIDKFRFQLAAYS